MKKDKSYKNIAYTKYELISGFVLLLFTLFIFSGSKKIISICGSAGLLGVLLIYALVYLIYRYVLINTFSDKYDFFEVIKYTFSQSIQKIIGITLFLFCLAYTYIIIHYTSQDLKSIDYNFNSTFNIYIYYIVAIFFILKTGFSCIFKIFGYTSIAVILYLIFTLILCIPQISTYNLFPILGNDKRSLFITNFKNIDIFAPLMFILFFNIKNKFKIKVQNNIKNELSIFSYIISISTICFLIFIFIIIGTIPLELLNDKGLDIINKFTILQPLNILIYSFLSFLTTGFISLFSCYSLERLKLVKDQKKTAYVYILLITFMLILIPSQFDYKMLESYFNIFSIIIAFVFPLLTIFIYKIKEEMLK